MLSIFNIAVQTKMEVSDIAVPTAVPIALRRNQCQQINYVYNVAQANSDGQTYTDGNLRSGNSSRTTATQCVTNIEVSQAFSCRSNVGQLRFDQHLIN